MPSRNRSAKACELASRSPKDTGCDSFIIGFSDMTQTPHTTQGRYKPRQDCPVNDWVSMRANPNSVQTDRATWLSGKLNRGRGTGVLCRLCQIDTKKSRRRRRLES